MNQAILHQLAKTELHCHLDGSLSLTTIRQLAELAGISLPDTDAALRKQVTVSEAVESLMDYLKVFDFVRPLLQTKEALRLAAYDVAAQAAQENVLYTEIRFAPELSMDQGLTAKEVVEAVLIGLEDAHKEFGILAKALVCGLKQTEPQVTLDIFSDLVSLADKGLIGFDFAGNEADYPTDQLADVIEQTQALGLPMTFHAGECGCVNNVAYALQLNIKRIGHGTALFQSQQVIDEVVAQGAAVEMCLTSNLQTGAVASIEEFPYPQLYQAEANITINTDNRTVSDTNLTKEYGLFVQHFGTTVDDFYRFNRNAIEASFASSTEKEMLLDKLKQAYYPD